MITKEEIDAIASWVEAEDVGGFSQWLDKLQALKPIAAEYNLSLFEAGMLFLSIAQLYKITGIKTLLLEMMEEEDGDDFAG